MRIVEINTVCDRGSTGRIAATVARLASDRGHDVYFAYGRGSHPDDIAGYKIGNRADFVCHVLLNFFKGRSGFGSVTVTRRFLKWLDGIKPDVLHLHNIHGFYINIEMLFDYIKEHDLHVVWTLHDCWPFTGQCAYFDYAGCDRWRTGCHDCPVYRKDYPYSLFCDNSKDNYADKKSIFCGVNRLTVVTPSKWLKDLVGESFLKEYRTVVINNGIDTGVFREKAVTAEEKGRMLSKYSSTFNCNNLKDKRIVLGVANVWSERKGADAFYKLAGLLDDRYLIVMIGVSSQIKRRIRKEYEGRIIGIGHTESTEELAAWYNIADVYVNPTLDENYPTTNLEAFACGTPVVTYDTGGCRETIDPEHDRVISKGDLAAMAEAIKLITDADDSDVAEVSEGMIENKGLSAAFRLSEYMSLFEDIANGGI